MVVRIGITGIDGLIGWHLRCFLNGLSQVEVVPCGRATFTNKTELEKFVLASDAIVHLAGMNRGKDREIERTNVALTQALIEACVRTARSPQIPT